ncbi:MAG TPA: hypothetical protein VLN56_07545 [Gammaproteobacteria bacterium]|nr:hypothetical protein [Gammaproteobacteria bacterium]
MLKALKTLFRVFFKICLLRGKPQELPNSIELLSMCLLAAGVVNFLLALFSTTAGNAVLASIVEIALIALITLAVLQLNRHPERWLKTMMALTGTGIILSLIALPLFFISLHLQELAVIQLLAMLAYLGLIVWNIMIMGHILRHALETGFGVGILFALTYIVITSISIALLLPGREI